MRAFLFVSLVLAAFTGRAIAHHGFGAEFDNKKPISMTGTVSKVEWTNPHVHIYVDSKGEDGTIATWQFELGSPSNLMREGWTRDSLKPGGTVSVEGFSAKDGTNAGLAKTVTVNGKKMLAGAPPAAFAGPVK